MSYSKMIRPTIYQCCHKDRTQATSSSYLSAMRPSSMVPCDCVAIQNCKELSQICSLYREKLTKKEAASWHLIQTGTKPNLQFLDKMHQSIPCTLPTVLWETNATTHQLDTLGHPRPVPDRPASMECLEELSHTQPAPLRTSKCRGRSFPACP